MEHVLEVNDLTVQYAAADGIVDALKGVTFGVRRGEVVGVLGESGSGKTTLGLSILRLLPSGGDVAGGSLRLQGRDLLSLSEKDMESVRGAAVSMIFQEPYLALNPFLNVIGHVQEVIRAHHRWSSAKCFDQARRVLARVHLDTEARLLTAYPHQLSGGERQRLVAAQALACGPALLIADEPTASLDSILQLEWSQLIKEVREELSLALLLITHDPALLAGLADRVLVLYDGRVIEEAPVNSILDEPLHPYTQALLRSMLPEPGADRERKPLSAILPQTGQTGNLHGCAFAPFCPDKQSRCYEEEPPDVRTGDRRRVRCWKYRE